MTTTAPRPPRTGARAGAASPRSGAGNGPRAGATAQPTERRGFAAVVPIRRMFAPEHRDALLVIGTTLFLTGFGLVMVLSASSVEGQAVGDPFGRVLRQAIFAAVGIPLMLVAGRLPVTFWKRWAWPALLGSAVLQLLVFVPGLSNGNGFNTAWVTIGSFQFQPSEFLKFALILWIASVFARRPDEIGDVKRLMFPVVPIVAVAVGLVLAGKDLGTASIVFIIVFACAFFAGAKIWHLLLGLVGVGLLAVAVAVTNPNRVDRITSFLNGCTDVNSPDYGTTCFQTFQAYFGLANGGVLGVGLGNSRAKWDWLPEQDSDYIFAIIGEELGLIGAVVIIALFVVLAIALFRIMRKSADPFARVVTGGILVWVVGQAFINIAVVLGLLPVLGVPLPLISAGGSSLLAILLALGVVLSFTRQERQRPR